MSSHPLVSVIIPTYNRAGMLRRALQSVCAQTHAHLEVILVDDGSTDDTELVVRDFEDHRFSYIRQSNSGAPAARNAGIGRARGEFVAFLDSDDERLPDKVTAQLNRFRTSELPALGVVTCGA